MHQARLLQSKVDSDPECITPGVYRIQTIIGSRSECTHYKKNNGQNKSNLITIPCRKYERCRAEGSNQTIQTVPPSLYVLNAAALTKPHAMEQLHAEITSLNVDISIICETHLKTKHTDTPFEVNGYTLFRRDRHGRRGGGVAIYARQSLNPIEWHPMTGGDPRFELLWIHTTAEGSLECLVGAMYHPPKPIYQTNDLIDHICAVTEEIIAAFPGALVILAGDMNTLPVSSISEGTGLLPIVNQPTRGNNILDQVMVSMPCYNTVQVVQSTVKTDHRAIVVHEPYSNVTLTNKKTVMKFRRRSPEQHAAFLQYLSDSGNEILETENEGVLEEFDSFYSCTLDLLDRFYPERAITISSRDPYYITPQIKHLLRQKNKLMRRGKTEMAAALASQVGKAIARRNATQFVKTNHVTDTSRFWEEVAKFKKQQRTRDISGLTANQLNNHYAAVSTDLQFKPISLKQGPLQPCDKPFTEPQVFKILDSLKITATGLDKLPAWFLRLGAPFLSRPLTRLFNKSLQEAIVPLQWKMAIIKPIPKIKNPLTEKDFRPISITPVLSRVMEKLVVRTYIYPAILDPPDLLTFADQFAFRPTGSTTAALIFLFNRITELLLDNTFVIFYSLDFSKAFDTVRHSTLFEKLAMLRTPIQVYNWIADYYSARSHCTSHEGIVSELVEIFASVIQGSGIGPAAYTVNAADLRTINQENSLSKFADDTGLIVAEKQAASRELELKNISDWAVTNNLCLNHTKSAEMIFTNPRQKNKSVPPPPIAGIPRVQMLKLLGVIISDNLSMREHVSNLISSCEQALYGLRMLKSHGMSSSAVQTVFQAVIVSKLTYAAPAWIGFTNKEDLDRLDSFLRRSVRFSYAPPDQKSFCELVDDQENKLFQSIVSNPDHVLYNLLPPKKHTAYNMRQRVHDFAIPTRQSK